MLNKLKKILQWFVSVCFILSGLIYVGEYTVPAIVLMVLAGVIVLPPVTKKIPAFKFRKAILIITSMVLLSAGMITGENNLSPEVQAKRAAAAEAAASSKAVMEAQKAAESASHAAKETEEAASKKAQEEADAASKAAEMAASKAAVAAEAESTANKKREEANEKIKEYLIGQFRLILRFDIRTDKFFGIVIKIAHLYGFQGSWNVIPRMLAKIIDGIPI